MLGGILNINKINGGGGCPLFFYQRDTMTQKFPAANHTEERNYFARNDNAAEDTEQVHNGLLLLKIPNSTKGLGVKQCFTVIWRWLEQNNTTR